ncbi:hypothetical protein ACWA1C_07720 [Flectobacillus roseus]
MDRFCFYDHQIDLIATSSDKFSSINSAILKFLNQIDQDGIVYFEKCTLERIMNKESDIISYPLHEFETIYGIRFKIYLPVKYLENDSVKLCFDFSEGKDSISEIPLQYLNLILLGLFRQLINSQIDCKIFPNEANEHEYNFKANFEIGVMKVYVEWSRDLQAQEKITITRIKFEF